MRAYSPGAQKLQNARRAPMAAPAQAVPAPSGPQARGLLFGADPMLQVPAAQGVVQRQITSVKVENDTVTSVGFDGSRVGIKRGGQHTTAFTVFQETIRNNLMGKKAGAAMEALRELVRQFTYLPTFQSSDFGDSKSDNPADLAARYVKEMATADASSTGLRDWANVVLEFRNSLDRASYPNKSPTHSNVNEGDEAGALEVLDDGYRNGSPPPHKQDTDVYPHVWNLFHYDPGKTTSEAELAALLITHAYSIQLAYPNIPYLTAASVLQSGWKSGDMKLRVVNRDNYDWFAVNAYLTDYIKNQKIPQYVKKPKNDYGGIIGNFGYKLQE
ncbi:MAG TPA: hypothetical protein VNT75_26895 [Symbiobacteriaceae bacterium]|nr:hypothetical protein [Symbiobacteriaceae bacterium]